MIRGTGAGAATSPQFIFGWDMLKRHQCVLDMTQSDLAYFCFVCSFKYLGAWCAVENVVNCMLFKHVWI
jgi:hypothetical protein